MLSSSESDVSDDKHGDSAGGRNNAPEREKCKSGSSVVDGVMLDVLKFLTELHNLNSAILKVLSRVLYELLATPDPHDFQYSSVSSVSTSF